jgi:enamine deaminase RidA (YjgF/YER057c/UK114 family)
VPTKSFATVGGIVEINLIALTNGTTRKKQVVETDIPGMAAYGPCIKVGEFLLPSGLIAIGRDGYIAGRTISPGLAGLAHAGHIQAEAIYDYAEALCQAAGTTMAKLLRVQYFVADVAVFFRGCHGLVDAVRTPAAPLRVCADADANASARNSHHCRFLDADPTIARLTTRRSRFSN